LANACTRVHPVEWAIGEVAGMLASFTLETGFQAHDLLERAALQAVLFARLDQRGIARRWPEALLSLRPATPRAA
jgi:uncharacterized membrane protein